MDLHFAASPRSTVGIEWELMLVDPASGALVQHAPAVIAAATRDARETRFTVTGELLTNTVEVTSGVGATVAEAALDISHAVQRVSRAAEAQGIALVSAGTHPFALARDQHIAPKPVYDRLLERTRWWGRNMLIWGSHVHVGVESRAKVVPLVNALATYVPHCIALSASSPYWAGDDTGYASQRTLLFQQLPTAGLPPDLADWDAYVAHATTLRRAGVISQHKELRWTVRPAPDWGTVEIRAFDAVSTLGELATMSAFAQCLTEHLSRTLDAGASLPSLPEWVRRENSWRAARYGLRADIITDASGSQRGIRCELEALVETLAPVAAHLGCSAELAGVHAILANGNSADRQRRAVATHAASPRGLVSHLINEFSSHIDIP